VTEIDMRAKLFGFVTAIVSVATMSAGAATLDDVKKKGEVSCGVNTGLPGFSMPDQSNKWSGLDVDLCRAVAAAALGDANKVKFRPLTANERFTALQSGEVDILSRNTTWTQSRDSALGITFVGVTYYDGQGFMVKKKQNVKSAKELDGAAVCVLAGTTTELNLADYFRANKMSYKPVVFDTSDKTTEGFEADRCDVLTSDQSQLYSLRTKLKDPDSAMVLPEIISKEPLGAAVRQNDAQWAAIVRWSLFAMINAEDLGVDSKNADEMKKSTNPDIQRFIGTTGEMGKNLSLDNEWAYRIVKQVGNYGESFERNVGAGSPLKIARGLNALWNKGGIMYAPPIR
jgi:general L-amino acid transport system substrate-binding protein